MQKKKNIKNNVQKYRVWKSMHQKDLAEAVNISVSEIRLIERNKVYPRSELRERLCEYFGVAYDQMFYEEQL
jgi:DNA-binding XRE family transcriptional regulator